MGPNLSGQTPKATFTKALSLFARSALIHPLLPQHTAPHLLLPEGWGPDSLVSYTGSSWFAARGSVVGAGDTGRSDH